MAGDGGSTWRAAMHVGSFFLSFGVSFVSCLPACSPEACVSKWRKARRVFLMAFSRTRRLKPKPDATHAFRVWTTWLIGFVFQHAISVAVGQPEGCYGVASA